MFIQDLNPPIKVLVRKEYLRDQVDGHGEYVEGYVFAVTSIPSRPLLFTVHTVDGAVVSRLPISAFTTKPSNHVELGKLQLWSCFSETINVIYHQYLKNYHMLVRIEGTKEPVKGTYLFTIDSLNGSLAETPDQHKTWNVGVLDTGQLFALPNNRCFFLDQHFVDFKGKPDYLTNTQVYNVENDLKLGVFSTSTEQFYTSKE